MTESVHRKINQVKEMVSKLSVELVGLREQNAQIQLELSGLKTENIGLKTEINSMEIALNNSGEELAFLKEQNNDTSSPTNPNKEKEIDELVKEIEYCIGQLKK